jgi:hypothetical protein
VTAPSSPPPRLAKWFDGRLHAGASHIHGRGVLTRAAVQAGEVLMIMKRILILLREGDVMRAVQDRHVLGLFPRATWLARLDEAGFDGVVAHPRGLDGQAWCEVFTAVRR